MRKRLVGGLCAALFLSACGPKVGDHEYLLTGTLSGVPDSTVIGLYESTGNLMEMVQSDTVIGGRFAFRDTVSSVKNVMLMSKAAGFPNTWLDVWVAPGKHIEVSGTDKLIALWNVKSDLTEQTEANRYTDCARDLLRQQLEGSVLAKEWLKEMMQKQQSGDAQGAKVLWGRIDSLRNHTFPLEVQIAQRQLECMKTAKVSAAWLDNLSGYAACVEGADAADYLKGFADLKEPLQELYASLSDSLKQTPQARQAYNSLYPPQRVKTGDLMADGLLYDTEGDEHRLAELKGAYILLDFWSQGCGPCLQALPEMEEMAETYAGRLAVVSICSDPEALWKRFIREEGLKGIQWNELRDDGGGLAAAYGVQAIPHYVLIAPDGRVKDAWIGYSKGAVKEKLKLYLK